jgi:oxygen-dependent protoporphyrinogen oxidase
MKMAKILVLGGGISGLSAAWFLREKYPDAEITLLEKEKRLGGWIHTENGLEKGPRTFQAGRSPHLLALISALGLEKERINSDPSASIRYLWHRGKLRTATSFLPGLLPALFREFWIQPSQKEDESIWEFASRRFSPKIADTLFDPITLGIFAGDIRTLSMRSCFPKLFAWERETGSLMRGFFSHRSTQPKGLFSLKGGMETLIRALREQLSIEIVLDCEVESLTTSGVRAGGRTWSADWIFSALPAPIAGRFGKESFKMNSLFVVNLVYEPDVLQKKGFGYLVPSQEKESLLGMIFDSSIFPAPYTILTAMVRAEAPDPVGVALDAASRHLGIEQKPLSQSLFCGKEAIPQFEVGFWQKIARFEAEMKQRYPHLFLLGNYFEDPSVEGCIRRSYQVTKLFTTN